MLDTDTKRRIDTARDMLVGKLPDPKSQVEQITIALIYKFMDDMDVQAVEEFKGERTFFADEFEQYSWQKLMHSGLGGHETLTLYSEAIDRMPQNPGIPVLFREIFKNAFLPYRDPETLRMFLKVIDEFKYDHSERLGDAFEYLLSVLGSQGEAGQFRTPRHIIEFIVDIVDPKLGEVILDPACGTAGFLISAYKHIQAANTKDGKLKLTPAQKEKLNASIHGYDISPDMVRLSLVNLFLHNFRDPHIEEYDTLTSEEKWTETADVILANPPFMSPKGGIKPHHRFSVQSKRSEVLFVDYIAEHLNPEGRAGVIVPEGVIFQNQTAYKQLRKMMNERYLIAVISLPSGVFNPYSGVKTSILIFDRPLAAASDSIGFFKVENDGYGLGAKRREIDKNDLPPVLIDLRAFFQAIRDKGALEELQLVSGLIVPKDKIAENGDYNLSGERYRQSSTYAALDWPLVPLGELCVVERGASPRPIHEFITNEPDGVNWIKIGDALVGSKYITETKERVTLEGAAKSRPVKPGDFVLSNSMSFGRPYIMATDGCIHDGWLLLRDHSERIDQDFLYHILGSEPVIAQFQSAATGGVVNNLNSQIVRKVRIPLPPLDVQKEIVEEIEGYQKVIDGARTVTDNYRSYISADPDWPEVNLGDICTLSSGGTPSKSRDDYWDGEIPWISAKDLKSGIIADSELHISEKAIEESAAKLVPAGTLLILVRGMGLANGVPVVELQRECAFNQDIKAIHLTPNVIPSFIRHVLRPDHPELNRLLKTAAHGTLKIDSSELLTVKVPLPALETQSAIMVEIEVEQTLVAANQELIGRLEKRIHACLARVWGDDEEDEEVTGEPAP